MALLAVAKEKRGSKVVKDQLQYGSALVAMILMGSQKVSEGFASANRDNRFINFLVRRVLRKANEKKALESKPAETGTKHPIMLTNPGWAMLAADAGLDDAKEAFTTKELTLRRSRLRLDFEILSARELKEAKTDEEVFRVIRKGIQGQRVLWVILVTWIACALRWFRVESLHVVRVGTGHGE